MSFRVDTSSVNKTGSVTNDGAKAVESRGRFLDNSSARRVIDGMGDRAPVYTASTSASRAVSTDRSVSQFA